MASIETDPRAAKEEDFPHDGSLEEKAFFLLNYAVLAPSGHNTQPWLFKLLEHGVEIIADRSRALPVVDPFDRELTISCGAAIGNFEVAARHFGIQTEVILSNDKRHPDRIATVVLSDPNPPDNDDAGLFDAMLKRSTNRSTYRDVPVPDGLIERCIAIGSELGVTVLAVTDPFKKDAIAQLVADGDHLQFHDPRFRRELASWVHSSRAGSRDGMSGTSFGMPDVLAPVARMVIRTFDLGDGIAAADAEKIKSGSPLLMVLATPEDTIAQWTNTGRALAKILLLLESGSLSASYLNQPIEMESLVPKLQTSLDLDLMPQILLRIGRSDVRIPPTVRRPVSDVLTD